MQKDHAMSIGVSLAEEGIVCWCLLRSYTTCITMQWWCRAVHLLALYVVQTGCSTYKTCDAALQKHNQTVQTAVLNLMQLPWG